MKTVIRVEHLTKKYGSHTVVDDLSFVIKEGTVFSLLGANGAGKSSTIECILGTRKYDTGSVTILEQDPLKNRKKLFEQIGVQFQEAKYQELIKVKELCEVTSVLYKNPLDYQELLTRFGISDKQKSDLRSGIADFSVCRCNSFLGISYARQYCCLFGGLVNCNGIYVQYRYPCRRNCKGCKNSRDYNQRIIFPNACFLRSNTAV